MLTLSVAALAAVPPVPAAALSNGVLTQGPGCVPPPYGADPYAPRPTFRNQTRAPQVRKDSAYAVQVFATGLSFPRSVAFLPDGRLLVVERGGRMLTIDKAGRLSAPIAGLPPIPQGRGPSLFDVALDPAFASNRTLYYSYFAPDPARAQPGRAAPSVGRIIRARLSAAGDGLEDQKILYEGGAARRLAVGAKDQLFFSTASADGKEAQALDKDGGKVLRIRTDGSVPKDNPLVGRPGALAAIYSWGHRAVDGLTVRAGDGAVWAVENGPRGGDELNRIRPGRDYGFPTIGYGREYSNDPINGDLTAKAGMEQPVYFWTPDIAPSDVMFYSGRLFPQWKGDAFVSAMVSKRLFRLVMRNGRVVGHESLLTDRCERIRAVRQGPDGALYVLTDESAAVVLRIVPKR